MPACSPSRAGADRGGEAGGGAGLRARARRAAPRGGTEAAARARRPCNAGPAGCARLRAVTRRTRNAKKSEDHEVEVVVGEIRINTGAHTVVKGDEALVLTPVEYDLLLALARARGRVRSREALIENIRDRSYDVFDRSIDVHISALRKKLGDDAKNPRIIRTVRAAGYMMVNPADDVR